MNRDLVINSINFNFADDDKGKSTRRSIARGAPTPDEMLVSHTTDSKGVRRSMLSFDRYDLNSSTGVKRKARFYFNVQVDPETTSAELAALKATFKACIASTSPDYIDAVFNGET